MSSGCHRHGGVSVGCLSALDPWEALLVRELRLWCEGPEGQATVWNGFALHLPQGTAAKEMRVFEDLIRTLSTFARRPLVRHGLQCDCLGADEAVFLQIVRAAAEGELGDAAMVSALVVLPAHAERVALMAGQVGLATQKIHAGQCAHARTTRPDNVVLLH
ncbi:hypothetical protein [uncultured Roseobacter sp.]|uniref:hypothetical protein n=1 Tax=uncultured Roseobacter sp. TaxID=114847 RepID=UPI002614ADFE|nr:hypothetical protein [uncultured Roseobacter sp.]